MENCYPDPAGDDEDCPQFIKKGKRSKRMMISDDEEEKENCASACVGENTKTSAFSPMGETVNSSGDSETHNVAALSTAADSDSESVEYNLPADVNVTAGQNQLFTSTFAGQSPRVYLTSSNTFNDDVSDGESSSREDRCTVADDRSDDTDGENDNRFDDSQVDPSLLAKLKRLKGASKSGQDRQKYSRKAKPKAEEMLEIYSESQRLLRDSRVSLPYHQPQPKLLEDFLARAAQKKQVYAGLQKAGDIQKARVFSDRLSLSPSLLASADKSRPNNAFAQHGAPGSTLKNTLFDCRLNNHTDLQSSVPMSSLKCISKSMTSTVQKSDIIAAGQVGDDELPDLCLMSPSLQQTGCVSENTCDLNSPRQQMAAKVNITDGISHTTSSNVAHTPVLRKDPSRDLFQSQNSVIDENEQTLHGQEQHICGARELQCTADNIKDGHCSSDCLDVPELASAQHTDTTTERVPHRNDLTNNLSEEQNPATNVSHTNTACSSQPLSSPALCSNFVSDSGFTTTPVARTSRQKLLDMLQGSSLQLSPSLSATPDGVICLDDAQPAPVVTDPGLMKLMSRLVKHSKKIFTTPVTGSSLGEKADQVAAQVNVETGVSTEISGYKLEQLKHQLGVGMREKRVEARQRRYDQFALDNEQGFGEEEEEEMESVGSETDDDEEETEKAGSSDSNEDQENVDANHQINMETSDSDDDDYTPHLDTEACDDDDDDDEQDKSSDVCLHFDVSDEEEQSLQGTAKDGEKMETFMRTNQRNPHLCTSEEESCDTVIIPRSSSCNLDSDEGTTDGAQEKSGPASNKKRPGSLRQWSTQTCALTEPDQEDTSKQTDFGRENSESPDLYSTRTDEHNLNTRSQWSHSADTNLVKYLDDDGFIKINETQQMPKLFLLPQTQASDNDDGFNVFGATSQMSAGHIFHGLATPASGKGEQQLAHSGMSSRTCVVYHSHDDDDDVVDPFHVLSDSEDYGPRSSQEKQEKAAFTDDDDDDDDDTERESDDGNDKKEKRFTELKKKKRTFRLRDFVDDEAELSGSEYDSDENVDVAEEDDILEEEAGDLDLQGVSEEKLRNEVGRLHMKQLQDDDDRAVMRYKEMYLQDGDLYSEGAGRLRNFRWKDVEYQSQQETFGYNSDEGQTEEDAEDAHWRKDRFEREKFLEKKDCGSDTDEGQLIKLGQFFLKKQESVPQTTDVTVSSTLKSSTSEAGQPKVQRKGSFLSRGKESLGKLAVVVQTTHNGSAGKNSRNFLFQTVDGPKDDDADKTDELQSSILGKRKAHTISTPDTSKKAKLVDTSSGTCREKAEQLQRHSSIFDLFTDI